MVVVVMALMIADERVQSAPHSSVYTIHIRPDTSIFDTSKRGGNTLFSCIYSVPHTLHNVLVTPHDMHNSCHTIKQVWTVIFHGEMVVM